MNADDPLAALRPDGRDTVPMVAFQFGLRHFGGLSGVRAKRRAVEAAVEAVDEAVRAIPDERWTDRRRRRLAFELRDAASALAAWEGWVEVVVEGLEVEGWKFNEKTGVLEVRDSWNRARRLYNETVCDLYDALRPGYVRDTGDETTKNPKGLRLRLAAELGPLPAEYLDTRAGRPLHNAVKNHVKNLGG